MAWLLRRGFGNTWVTMTPRALAPSSFTKELDELLDRVANCAMAPAALAELINPAGWAPVPNTITACTLDLRMASITGAKSGLRPPNLSTHPGLRLAFLRPRSAPASASLPKLLSTYTTPMRFIATVVKCVTARSASVWYLLRTL